MIADPLFDAMAVPWPEGQSGDVALRKFHISEEEARWDGVRALIHGTGRAVQPGTYTKLLRGRTLWMSDTPAERYDHLGFVRRCRRTNAERVLVSGLGLGMVSRALLHVDSVQHVDVVDIDADVIALVGPHLEKEAADRGKRVEIHQGDAMDPAGLFGRTGQRWDAAWHDIWPTICGDDYEDHKRIRRAYARRAAWQDVWQGDQVKQLATRPHQGGGWF